MTSATQIWQNTTRLRVLYRLKYSYHAAQVPRTFGDSSVHISNVDVALYASSPMHLRSFKEGGAAEDAIGKLVSCIKALLGRCIFCTAASDLQLKGTAHPRLQISEHLIRDGATLQLGIGAIPDFVLRYCSSHKDLGIHSEMVRRWQSVSGLLTSKLITAAEVRVVSVCSAVEQVSDGMLDLIEKGCVNNVNKKVDPVRQRRCDIYC
jgi:hypothetical protein